MLGVLELYRWSIELEGNINPTFSSLLGLTLLFTENLQLIPYTCGLSCGRVPAHAFVVGLVLPGPRSAIPPMGWMVMWFRFSVMTGD